MSLSWVIRMTSEKEDVSIRRISWRKLRLQDHLDNCIQDLRWMISTISTKRDQLEDEWKIHERQSWRLIRDQWSDTLKVLNRKCRTDRHEAEWNISCQTAQIFYQVRDLTQEYNEISSSMNENEEERFSKESLDLHLVFNCNSSINKFLIHRIFKITTIITSLNHCVNWCSQIVVQFTHDYIE